MPQPAAHGDICLLSAREGILFPALPFHPRLDFPSHVQRKEICDCTEFKEVVFSSLEACAEEDGARQGEEGGIQLLYLQWFSIQKGQNFPLKVHLPYTLKSVSVASAHRFLSPFPPPFSSFLCRPLSCLLELCRSHI